MKRSRITRRPSHSPLSAASLSKSWKQSMKPETQKKVRIFNNYSYSAKGKIRLDGDTWVEYDYGRDFPVIKLRKKDQITDKNAEQFKLSKYPTLHSIVDQKIPEPDQKKFKPMDLLLIKNSNQALLYQNGTFEFF